MTGREAILSCTPYWSLDENWGDPDMVDPSIVLESCEFRKCLDRRLYISPVEGAVYATGGHSGQSWHKVIAGRNDRAMAMDVFPECPLEYAWVTALRFGFGGIGCYPHFRYPSKGIIGMLHLDMRPHDKQHERALWWVDSKGGYRYLRDSKDTFEFLRVLHSAGSTT